jgi:hypothetical protein
MTHHSRKLGITDKSLVVSFNSQNEKVAQNNKVKVLEPEKPSIVNTKNEAHPTYSKPEITTGGVWVDPRGVASARKASNNSNLSPEVFKEILRHHLRRQLNGEGR